MRLIVVLILLVGLIIIAVLAVMRYLSCNKVNNVVTKIMSNTVPTKCKEKYTTAFLHNDGSYYYAYNPSIIYDNDGKLVTIVRVSTPLFNYESMNYFDLIDKYKSVLNIHNTSHIFLYDLYNIENIRPVLKTNISNVCNTTPNGFEDPRLFKFQNKIWIIMSFRGKIPEKNIICGHHQVICPLSDPSNIVKLKYNKSLEIEKNWLPFEHNGELYAIYSIIPYRVIKINSDTGKCVNFYYEDVKNKNIILSDGVGGGSAPVLAKIKNIECFLVMGHSRQHNIGFRKNFFFTISPTPPFRLLEMSSEIHLDPANNIEFGSGLVVDGDNIKIAVGIDDYYFKINTYTKENIEKILSPVDNRALTSYKIGQSIDKIKFELITNRYRSHLENIPIYYINLDRSTERRDTMEEQIKLLGLTNIQRIPGIDGLEGITDPYTERPKSFSKYKIHPTLKSTAAGCLLAHLAAMKKGYDDGHDMILVLEDDANIMLSAFWSYTLDDVTKDTPDWEIINFYPGKHPVKFSDKYLELFDINKVPWGCIVYAIKRKYMKHLLDITDNGTNIEKYGDTPTDIFIYENTKNSYNYVGFPMFFINCYKFLTTMEADGNDSYLAKQIDKSHTILYMYGFSQE